MDILAGFCFNQDVHQTRRNRVSALIALLLSVSACLHAADPAAEYAKEIRPLLEKYCYECHGPEKHKAELNLASFHSFEQVEAAPQVWETVLERVQSYEMPPKGRPDLEFTPHQHLVDWLRRLSKSPDADCDQVASDRNTSSYHGYVISRRLNPAEYNNTVRDLIGVDLHLQELLPSDGGGGEGFDTAGSALFTSSIHIEKYLAAAERIVRTVLPGDSAGLSPELARARRGILIAEAGPCRSPQAAARTVIESFAHRAFRRPVGPAEVDRLLRLFDRSWERGEGYVPAVRLALKGVLVAPDFLFLPEPEPEGGGVQPLPPAALACRLSYFLWSSMPDDELLALAENGDLLNDECVPEARFTGCWPIPRHRHWENDSHCSGSIWSAWAATCGRTRGAFLSSTPRSATRCSARSRLTLITCFKATGRSST